MTVPRDTIFALASGGLPAGVAVVRLSGPLACSVAAGMVGGLPEPRVAALRTIRDASGSMLDRGLVILFPGPNSFTGEDCVEMHLHGGPALVAAVLDSLAGFIGCRLAEAGEFSRRAFENGKMDLVEIEGLADLLSAETEMQRRLATEQSNGHLSSIYEGWRERLIFCRAMIEAELDFSDEGDIPGAVSDRVWREVETLVGELDQVLSQLKSGEIIRDGFKVVIAGRPNAGKSSLLNALVNRDVAIVTHYAGTTRDILHCELDLSGYKVHLYDTAGLRATDEPVEREGIRRALVSIQDADLVLHLVDLTIDESIAEISNPHVLEVGTKSDLIRIDSDTVRSVDLMLSTATGNGLNELRSRILAELQKRVQVNSLAIPSRLRHAQLLSSARLHLIDALNQIAYPLEIRAESLRLGADDLARVTGRIDTETLLGKIFAEFCVGK
ncbi:tRNA uridine-5-carboxymethylaminomethyl(34) synthesis GTPase MnmE [Rhizobium sp. SL42]|uniref:tRNA uridine-5-carboxymethylaminomethyl(34) synthesis GTPase MnmE n=1 Tax=Rhizobium sp. SL42 TaxID=2806346 RepID=UPI001EFF666F|nr:tRNA uridine-5-carboxymethylaminomethyl(34) synthesis GTPase MnmE [Rhizobium sp. SL42]UJW75463.1 tRNA uridine-5-carboxymethylaminomethyl(34) synthesis GTPase MnmE [Rhizobium sp. SL42]